MSYFASFRKISAFIWQRSPARISLYQLSKPKHLGGISHPDIKAYYLPCQATRVVDWYLHEYIKDWLSIEQLFTPDPLRLLLWLPRTASLGRSTLHSLTQTTLHNFKTLCTKYNLSSSPSQRTPVRSNPDFPPGIPQTFLQNVCPHRDIRALEFF